jgi:hypothetical protein
MAMRILACLLLLLAAPALQAQMYKCKDERGRWVFSDKPLPGCADAPETPGTKSPAPQSPPLAKPATPQSAPASSKAPARSAAATVRTPQKPAPMTEQERAYFASECKSAREQLQWLLGPRGKGVENREARAGVLKQKISQCPG